MSRKSDKNKLCTFQKWLVKVCFILKEKIVTCEPDNKPLQIVTISTFNFLSRATLLVCHFKVIVYECNF